jgi:hypothetical protein
MANDNNGGDGGDGVAVAALDDVGDGIIASQLTSFDLGRREQKRSADKVRRYLADDHIVKLVRGHRVPILRWAPRLLGRNTLSALWRTRGDRHHNGTCVVAGSVHSTAHAPCATEGRAARPRG